MRLLSDPFQGPQGAGGFGGFDFSQGFEDVFSDIFGDFFGTGRGRSRSRSRRGDDLRYDLEIEFEEAARLISKVRTIAAYTYRRGLGLPFIYPDPKLRYVANFLHMMFSMPYAHHDATPEVVQALNLILMLHADHEQNCSTSTVRIVGSSQANMYASCSAGVCALWGPLHGGANVAVLEMLEEIHKGGLSAEKTLALAKDTGDGAPR